MKRKFSFIVALIASVMFIAIGCSNASNITIVDDSNKGNFTENGMSLLTVKIGSFSNSRTILPDDWSDGKKELLGFKLTATDKGSTGATFTGKEITYEQIKNNDFSVEMQPANWDFVLTAYQLQDGGLTIDEARPVLEAKQSKDLTNGSQEVVFDLKPLSASTDSKLVASKGVGDVAIEVNFTQEANAIVYKVELDILNSDGTSINLGGDNSGNPVKVTKETTEIGERDPSASISTAMNYAFTASDAKSGIKAGDYTFVATFYDNGPKNDGNSPSVMAQYMSSLRVDGGNLSSDTINIPAGVFNSKPVNPKNLSVKTSYEPADENKVVISQGENASQNAATTIKDNKYNITFSWTDDSFNEQSFVLAYGNEFTVECVGGKAELIPGTGKNAIKAEVAAGQTGTMAADCTSVTLSIPMGTFLTASDVNIYAKNAFGTSEAGTKDGTVADSLGMFIVEYNLKTPNSGVTAKVKANQKTTTQPYFVQAFNYGESKELITGDSSKPVSVSATGYKFSNWHLKGQTDQIVTKTNFESKIENKNTEIEGTWLTSATIKVSYPSYANYKDLTSTDKGVDTTVIPYKAENITFTLPSAMDGTFTNVVFKIFSPSNKPVFNSKSDDLKSNTAKVTATIDNLNTDNLVWDIKTYFSSPTNPETAPEYGTYGVYISYNYNGAPVSGYYYVKIVNK